MARKLVVAAGQMGPASDDKAANVETVLRLMDEAAGSGGGVAQADSPCAKAARRLLGNGSALR